MNAVLYVCAHCGEPLAMRLEREAGACFDCCQARYMLEASRVTLSPASPDAAPIVLPVAWAVTEADREYLTFTRRILRNGEMISGALILGIVFGLLAAWIGGKW